MRFFAIFIPPIAVLMAGKPFQAIIALLLWFCLWVPGSLYAWGIVSDYKADKRMIEQVRLQKQLNNQN
ncbi:YqaE/Pmp3 family membrane protein [Salipaludibacillus agaradhaerens]|uniref:YqaE/Pmp3 family membrane protein n=1 Tax=Salipaludibacillus agaradhaerens TaxID=76935 RepID=A0A9Q4B288_SALAG|nr:YqaE/Pmp3 family membrane protein [Salipaludibacillus agaradhaerens]MCR6096866.1 YqaE/Pmp3 family membrane protein [Salipaludibacillus agaradhaerens]MCR6116710.1 YqaE/Pmp3 family membrane protein [Salipaludibacillus agaradhaerens]